MKKSLKIIIPIAILAIITTTLVILNKKEQNEIIQITSTEELEKIYERKTSEETIFSTMLKLPFSLFEYTPRYYTTNYDWEIGTDDGLKLSPNDFSGATTTDWAKSETTKEYSTTNIQVENVDEADVTKTDGDYIYSLSENQVIITDVKKPEEIKVVAKISENSNKVPEDLILYNNKLTVIYEELKTASYNNKNITYVAIYDISTPEKPKKIKNYELEQPYYTSRCIDGKLYVISSGTLKKEKDKIVTYYYEDGQQIDKGVKNINKIKDLNTNYQTILSNVDLNNIENKVNVNSYLMNINNCYVSENNIYLINEKYKREKPQLTDIFGLKGLLGISDYDYNREENGYYTEIYKFNLLEDGNIKFAKKALEKGTTINQFSIDEYKNNLRVALQDSNNGTKIVILDENMEKIGETTNLAKGEKMYSSRFLGEKAYLVTYKTIDPLFVVDLSNPQAPEVLGELKIPGYSTYLHPYDENHIIGIGMQTEEKVNRNSSGKVISTTATITGMKMALFDVTDVQNPIQISDTIIGDRRTTSSILTNHKALLFSKEKQIIAIPVNNYQEDFSVTSYNDNYSTMINSYKSYPKEYISEGYFVYNINLTDGFKLKGTITHDKNQKKNRYTLETRLLRGLYIENNLYTISEDYIKVNKMEDLQEISQLEINKSN